jgi:hypothetical protein
MAEDKGPVIGGIQFGADEFVEVDAVAVEEQAEPAKAEPAKRASRAKNVEVAEPAAVVETAGPLRPSVLRAMAIAATKNVDVDVHRWAKEEGLPTPLRRYRVTPTLAKHVEAYPALEVDAVDEGAAVGAFLRDRNVRADARHSVSCRCVCLEE